METEKKENQTQCDCCEWRMGLSEIAEAIGSQSSMEAILKINPDLVRAVFEAGLDQHLRAARIASCECHALADK